jgi:hypothetical protein
MEVDFEVFLECGLIQSFEQAADDFAVVRKLFSSTALFSWVSGGRTKFCEFYGVFQ